MPKHHGIAEVGFMKIEDRIALSHAGTVHVALAHPRPTPKGQPILKSSTLNDVNHKIAELQQAIQFFESKLPQEKEMDTILKEVWQIAEANSLQTKTIKTGKSSTLRMSFSTGD